MLSIDAEFNELLLVFRPNPRGLGAIGEFGEFGMALGEISAVEKEIHAQWRGVVKAGLGELADIQQDIETAKKNISDALNIEARLNEFKSNVAKIQNKLNRAKNPAAKAKIQEKLNFALPQLNIAQGAWNSMQGLLSMSKDVLAKAGIIVEEAKKAVVETATAAREKAMRAAQKAKEVALAFGGKVKAAAGAAAEAAKQKVAQVGAKARQIAAETAARARAVAESARAIAAQKAAQAKAMAQAAAQRVQQAAAQARARAQQVAQQAQARAVQVAQQARQAVTQRAAKITQTARSVATPIVQRAQQATSAVKSWFGFRGLGEIGLLPAIGAAGYISIILSAIPIGMMFLNQAAAVPSEDTTGIIPVTIPAAAMEQYKVAASECYNSAVAQGYVVDTPEKEALLNKTCRDRAVTAYTEKASEIPYSEKIPSAGGLIDEFETSGGYVPTEGSPLEQMCAQNPTNPQCSQLVTQLPTGGGYYTAGEVPTTMTKEEYQSQQIPITTGRRIITRTPTATIEEPGVFDEFETLVPGVQPVPGYEPGMPTKVPGVTPGYEPGFAPEYQPGAEFAEEECIDVPELTDEEYCAQFPQCCEDVLEEGEVPIEQQATSVWDFEGIGI